ncbi:MAG: N-acetylmuramoyl-L-alanine amidase [Clostridiales bacterium]|nr:N-acetylmuramoyl-L-alanine amidase [Clostridiales bacterium]
MKRTLLCLCLAFALLLSGCAGGAAQSESSDIEVESASASLAAEPEAADRSELTPEGSASGEGSESVSATSPEQEAADASEEPAPEEAASSDLTPEEEPLTFTEVSETVWATANVNIRTGPSTEADIVAVLSAGDSVTRTGYQEAWSQVDYEGAVCYISSAYLTTEEPVQPTETAATGHIVAIDPGHQAKGNSDLEPIGPGATEKKAKVSTGTSGVSTGVAESSLTLTVSLQLRDALEAEGYQVVMTRESQDVNISNAERAQIATDAGAEIFIRIHANGSENSSASGILALSPSSANPYVASLYEDSYRLSKLLVNELCAATGAKNLGVQTSDTMSGINWSTMPVSIVELGFMTNATEDQLLNSADYQAKLVEGMVNAVNAYFGA